MVMSWIFTGLVAISVVFALLLGNGSALAAAVPLGAQAGITLAISMAGSLCLWTGVGKLMEKAGFTAFLSKLLRPVLARVFPSAKKDALLAGALSANICANFLGLGNAATPMGIQAARRFAAKGAQGVASDELCRLIVLNTASIQLIPATVAAVRASLGCATPFDILPAVWLTSICSAGAGLLAARFLGRLWRK
jgi:spore maturation protein A